MIFMFVVIVGYGVVMYYLSKYGCTSEDYISMLKSTNDVNENNPFKLTEEDEEYIRNQINKGFSL